MMKKGKKKKGNFEEEEEEEFGIYDLIEISTNYLHFFLPLFFGILLVCVVINDLRFHHLLDDDFTDKAYTHMSNLCKTPRASGTIGEHLGRAYITEKVQDLIFKYHKEVSNPIYDVKLLGQHIDSHVSQWRHTIYHTHNITNLYVSLRTKDKFFEGRTETRKTGVVLMNAHYDSGYRSPGCADNALAVGVLLSMIKKLLFSQPILLQHDLIFMFAGGEEIGLIGSSVCTNSNYLKDYYAENFNKNNLENNSEDFPILFLNLEAAGVEGKAVILRASSEWILKEYSKNLKIPLGHVVFRDIFESGVLGSDTDYSMFNQQFQGIDLAIAEKSHIYHTGQDVSENIDNRTISSVGRQVLDFIHTFGMMNKAFPNFKKIQEKSKIRIDNTISEEEQEEEQFDSSLFETPIYFDIFQEKLVVLNFGDLRRIYKLTLIVCLIYIFCQHFIRDRKERIKIQGIFRELLTLVVIYLLYFVMNGFLGNVISRIIPMYTFGEKDFIGLLFLLFICFTSFVLVLGFLVRCRIELPKSAVTIIIFYSILMSFTFFYNVSSTLIVYLIVVFLVPADLLISIISKLSNNSPKILKISKLLCFIIFGSIPSLYILNLLHLSYNAFYGMNSRLYFSTRLLSFDCMLIFWISTFIFLLFTISIPFFNFQELFRRFNIPRYSFIIMCSIISLLYLMYYQKTIPMGIRNSSHFPFTNFGRKRIILEQVHTEENGDYFQIGNADILDLKNDPEMFNEIIKRFPNIMLLEDEKSRFDYWKYVISQIRVKKPFYFDNSTILKGKFSRPKFPEIEITKIQINENTTRFEIAAKWSKDLFYSIARLKIEDEERVLRWSFNGSVDNDDEEIYKPEKSIASKIPNSYDGLKEFWILEVFGYGYGNETYDKEYRFSVDLDIRDLKAPIGLEITGYYYQMKFFSNQLYFLSEEILPKMKADPIPIVVSSSKRILAS